MTEIRRKTLIKIRYLGSLQFHTGVSDAEKIQKNVLYEVDV